MRFSAENKHEKDQKHAPKQHQDTPISKHELQPDHEMQQHEHSKKPKPTPSNHEKNKPKNAQKERKIKLRQVRFWAQNYELVVCNRFP